MFHFDLTIVHGHDDLLRLSVKGNKYDIDLAKYKTNCLCNTITKQVGCVSGA